MVPAALLGIARNLSRLLQVILNKESYKKVCHERRPLLLGLYPFREIKKNTVVALGHFKGSIGQKTICLIFTVRYNRQFANSISRGKGKMSS